MPLDTGAAYEPFNPPIGGVLIAVPDLSSPDPLGEILRRRRERLGLSLEAMAERTRIRVRYLDALERMRLEDLPSRPFALGYVRACAQALGLDPDLAVAKFKVDAPIGREPLRAPVGVKKETDPRIRWLAAAAGVVIVSAFVWNLAQHALAAGGPQRRVEPASPPSSAPRAAVGALALGAPLPAPAESTTPEPYQTPGLAPQSGAKPQAPPQQDPPGAPFAARGPVYGAQASAAAVIVQARRSGALVIHGGDGSVYFARQLHAGEAYRAPLLHGLTIDVGAPADFDFYVGGARVGPLPAERSYATDLARLAPAPRDGSKTGG